MTTAYVFISTAPDAELIDEVCTRLKKTHGVNEVYKLDHCEWDVLAKVEYEDDRGLLDAVTIDIRPIHGVIETSTRILYELDACQTQECSEPSPSTA